MIIESPVSRVYAQALVELGDKHASLGGLREEFDAFSELWKASEPLRSTLSSPAVHRETKMRIVTRVCEGRFSDLFRRFLGVLAEKGRLGMIEPIHVSFIRMLEDRGGIVRVRATFAICMEERLVSELEETLSEKLGKKVVLWVNRDPSILGGVVLQIGDLLVDLSLRNRLEQFREAALAAG